ncbi:hypothetical protein ACS0TY_015967 [Phlomoides rotata]
MAISDARCSLATTSFYRRFIKDLLGLSFSLLVFFALVSSFFHFFYVFSTSKLYNIDHQTPLRLDQLLKTHPQAVVRSVSLPQHENINQSLVLKEPVEILHQTTALDFDFQESKEEVSVSPSLSSNVNDDDHEVLGSIGNDEDVFHDRIMFMEEYMEMNKSLKIYVYPHKKDDPFANVLVPEKSEPGGNYASESYFKKSLFKSHFVTKDPSKADLFYLPFSIASLRNDKRVGVGGIQKFIKNYIFYISRTYPFWNRTGGADHFYVACHSVGRSAMEKAVQVKLNAIQVVCSSSYFLSGYVSHKDASIPQIWPRKGARPTRSPSLRKNLAFYAGAMNSRVRESLVETWGNDSEISIHRSRLKTPYSEALLGSKFCIHAKGFEVNTARIGDALYYGCVPIILADHYDLPYADVLNWKTFSLVLSTIDIPMLKKILQEINSHDYLKLQENVVRVQKHFQWNDLPVDYDTFYMIMYELWLRRSHARISLDY